MFKSRKRQRYCTVMHTQVLCVPLILLWVNLVLGNFTSDFLQPVSSEVPEGVTVYSANKTISIREGIQRDVFAIAEIHVMPSSLRTTTKDNQQSTHDTRNSEENTSTTTTSSTTRHFQEDLSIVSIVPETDTFMFEIGPEKYDGVYALYLTDMLDFESVEKYTLEFQYDEGNGNATFANIEIYVEDVKLEICLETTEFDTCGQQQWYSSNISVDTETTQLHLNGSFFVRDLDRAPCYAEYIVSFMADPPSIPISSTFAIKPEGSHTGKDGMTEFSIEIINHSLLQDFPSPIELSIMIQSNISKTEEVEKWKPVAWVTIHLNVTRDDNPTSTTAFPLSSSKIPSQTTIPPFLTTTTTTPQTTTTTFTTTKLPPSTGSPGCRKCEGTEINGEFWSVCAGTVGVKDCTVRANATGQAIWVCSADGEFVTRQPDYSGCRSHWLDELIQDQKNVTDAISAVEFLTNLENAITSFDSDKGPVANYFGHEIKDVGEILSNVINTVDELTPEPANFFPVAKKTVSLTQRIVSTKEPWLYLDMATRSESSTNLFKTVEATSFMLTAKVNVTKEWRQSVPNLYEASLMNDEKFYVASIAGTKSYGGYDTFEFPTKSSSLPRDNMLTMPSGWKNFVPGDKIECVGIFMDAEFASLIMPGQFSNLGLSSTEEKKKVLNGKLMSFTVAGESKTFQANDSKEVEFNFSGQKGVQIVFTHDLESWGDEAFDIPRKLHAGEKPKAALGTAQCVFWDTNRLIWSPEGCKVVSSSRTETTCECNHLTSFAILMDVHNYTGKNLGLEILTLVLCSMSIICLTLTILIFLTIRTAQSERTSITLHLAICLLVGNFLVIFVLDRNYIHMSEGGCIASGIITHYIFLAAFGWMAVEGAYLYNQVVTVFSLTKSPMTMYRVLAYGGPLVIVGVTCMAGYIPGNEPYGGHVVCWLNDQYIWGFMGPVLIAVLVNFVILSISLWKSYQVRNCSTKMRSMVSQRKVNSLRKWIQGCFGLTTLLGTTWLTGYFMLASGLPGLFAAYIFTIFNASQGIFILVFHCLCNEKVRQGIHRQHGDHLPAWFDQWLKTTPPTSATPSSDINKPPPKVSKYSTSESSVPSEEASPKPKPQHTSGYVPPVPPRSS